MFASKHRSPVRRTRYRKPLTETEIGMGGSLEERPVTVCDRFDRTPELNRPTQRDASDPFDPLPVSDPYTFLPKGASDGATEQTLLNFSFAKRKASTILEPYDSIRSFGSSLGYRHCPLRRHCLTHSPNLQSTIAPPLSQYSKQERSPC